MSSHEGRAVKCVIGVWVALVVVVAIVSSSALSYAATTAEVDTSRDKALAWLVTHQRGDGSWRGAGGAEFITTATAIEALRASGVRTYPYAAATAWLGNARVLSVDSLARQIGALADAGLSVERAVNELITARNTALAWGAYAKFGTTFPDTALAVRALRMASAGYADADYTTALCAIAGAQKTGDANVAGSWSYVGGVAGAPVSVTAGAILPTVYNLLEIDALTRAKSWTTIGPCGSTTYTVATVLDAGVTWLLTQRRNVDGGLGDPGQSTVLETALGYQLLAALRPSDAATTAALDFLIARQRPDGSWGEDPLQTAMALKALPPGTALTDTDGDGIPDRVESVIATSPTVADSRWLARGRGPALATPATAANDFGLVLPAPASGLVSTLATPSPAAVLYATSSTSGQRPALPRPTPFTAAIAADLFQADVFTGAARADIALLLPAGAAGVTPKLVLRYDSGSADDLAASQQAPATGLGWTLDAGPSIVRDAKNTVTTSDDTFTLVLDGKRHHLVLVDTASSLYRTKDDLFLRIHYDAGGDTWTVTTKDGVRHLLGSTTDSRQRTLAADLTTPLTARYLLAEVTTPSGVAMRYAYTKQSATLSNGYSYDQAVYLDTIGWAYAGASPIGGLRQVVLVYGDRTDWPAAGSAPLTIEKKRVDAVEVHLAGALVRRYAFGYDDSIDRDPTHTWAGGATGDLTLRTLTVVGRDGATALPASTFEYGSTGRLTRATHTFGGSTSFRYERLTTRTLYSVCSTAQCTDRGVCDDPDAFGQSAVLAHLLPAAGTDTVPIYSVCKSGGTRVDCTDWGVGGVSDGTNPTPLGYALSPSLPQPTGTVPLYSVCVGACIGSTTQTGELLGYVYVAPVDRHRAIVRAIDDGRGGTTTTSYAYTDPILSATDGAFLGYASTRATDATGAYTDTWFGTDEPRAGRVTRTQTRSSAAALYRDVTQSWTASASYPGVTAALLARTDILACEPGAGCRTTAETFEYDAHGNRTRRYALGDIVVTGDERDERTDWAVDGTAWLHRPARIALADAAGAVVREQWTSYDGLAWGSVGARGLATRDERRVAGALGAPGNAVVMHAWDGYGNRTATTDPGGCTTTVTYDDSQTHRASATNCLGHTQTAQWDAALGAPASETDANGQVTTYAYDTLGRLTRVTRPLDAASTYGTASWEYLDVGSPSLQRVVAYRTRDHGTGTAVWSEESLDGLGRVYRRRARGPGDQVIVTERTFDARGLVATRSAPYMASGDSAAWTTYSYDPLGRVTDTAFPDGTRVSITFGAGLVTTVNERGQPTRRYVDGLGRVVRVEEPHGGDVYVTTYAWDAADELTRITNHAGSVTTAQYDGLGRLLALADPNRGAWGFTYDPRGHVLTRTDARGLTTAFGYDLAGRLRTRTWPGGAQTEWVYDEPNPGAPYTAGRVTRVTDAVTSTTLTYDAHGRVTQAARLLDATTYTLGLQHNALDQVTSRTFPDGETVLYTYDEAGWLAAIPGYVTTLRYNARGQATFIGYANTLTTELAYHDQPGEARSFRLKSITTRGAGMLQHLAFTYDAGGRLTRIADAVGTAGRTFEYDALSRLTRAAGWSGGMFEGYRYDAVGNLLGRDALVYAYSDPSHPAAVTATADGRAYTYDANGHALTGGSLQLAWDGAARLQSVTAGTETVTYAYDADGHRVRRTAPSGVTRAPFPGFEIDGAGTVVKHLGLAVRKSTGGVLYLHADHRGAVSFVSDAAGVPVQSLDYGPWGEVIRLEGTALPLAYLATADRGGRLYDAQLGRFLTPDASPPDVAQPQRLNPYSYRANDPAAPSVQPPRPGPEDF